ncbi:metallophosphoesterase family protein [Paraclostridium dentum]|uniref:metallophosphoesterase family protein n=1 Tax=Paraclostridium dentum TaxID=2662455 RepID=UPI0014760A4F|nr:metallophosphoesterase family protein [Paraclostridium dentum]
MKIALISDIHSNIYALDSVLADIETKDVDMIVCTGDLVGYGTRPNEVIQTLKKNKILTIMGNYDDAIGNLKIVCGCDYPDPKDAEKAGLSMHFTGQTTTNENKEYLRNLPKELIFTFDNKTIRFVHGSTRLINEYLKENSKEADEVMSELVENILVCGHTHIPYAKYYGEKLLINAGSVGKPKTGKPNANYVIIDIKNEDEIAKTPSSVEVEIIEVEYDFERIANEIEESEILPNDFARLLREGSSK